jgi:uncharacterized iron-regulated membrane protein
VTRPRRWTIGPRAYTLLWDGHSIVGVITGLALFVMFFCGALALYRGELHQWMDPALRTHSTDVASIDALVRPILDAAPPKPRGSVLLVWPFAHRPYFYLQYESANGRRIAHWVAPHSGETLPYTGRSILPEMLNDLHFFRQLGTAGQLTAGVMGFVLLFATVTGVAIHLRKLPEDLHTFRPRQRLRVSLADAHAALGTIGIPFTAMYALTGAYFSLWLVVYGGLVIGTLQGDRQRVGELFAGIERPVFKPADMAPRPQTQPQTQPQTETQKQAQTPTQMMSFDELVSRYKARIPNAPPFNMEIDGWGDAAGLVSFEGNADRSLGASAIGTLNAVTGEIVASRAPDKTPPMTWTAAAFGVLHFARFGGQALKALFFVLALAASAVMLTGNVLWIEVRRPRDPRATPWLHRLLARLTSGIGVGLLAAVPAAFIVTRLLPMDQPDRMALEQQAFFLTWALLALGALAWPSALASARVLLALSGVLSVAVPIANGLDTGEWFWISPARSHWVVFTIDTCFLIAGFFMTWLASRTWRGIGSRH